MNNPKRSLKTGSWEFLISGKHIYLWETWMVVLCFCFIKKDKSINTFLWNKWKAVFHSAGLFIRELVIEWSILLVLLSTHWIIECRYTAGLSEQCKRRGNLCKLICTDKGNLLRTWAQGFIVQNCQNGSWEQRQRWKRKNLCSWPYNILFIAKLQS